MKIKQLPLVFGIMALFLFSCDTPVNNKSGYNGYFPPDPQSKTFRALNMVTDKYYDVPAKLLYVGERCTIWGEEASHVSPSTAHDMALTYDNTIYPRMMNVFNSGETFTEGGKVVARDPMELADYYGDGDGKLCILLLDIKDGYNGSTNTSYVGGYFSTINLYSKGTYPNSNECDMIYVDTYPVIPGSDDSNGTLAHEMQHLMNYVITLAKRGGHSMDTWINEGLSTSAEWVWNGKQARGRVDWYMDNKPLGLIPEGNNFYVWDNHRDNTYAILDDYATAYLFFQWLRLQAGSTNIYKEIINSTLSDYRAVTAAAGQAISSDYSSNWGLLLRDWFAANYINAPSGRYGYKNDPTLRKILIWSLSDTAGKSYSLAPGEGIYTKKTSMPAATTYIKYAGLKRTPTVGVSDTTASGYSMLLSYNIDTRVNGSSSSCNPFSVEMADFPGIQRDTDMSMASRSISQGEQRRPSGPYPISAGDMLRRNGHGEEFPALDLSKLRRGNKTDE